MYYYYIPTTTTSVCVRSEHSRVSIFTFPLSFLAGPLRKKMKKKRRRKVPFLLPIHTYVPYIHTT